MKKEIDTREMVSEEIKKFEELLKNRFVGDAGDLIKFTHNVLFYSSRKPGAGDGVREECRKLVLEDFLDVAGKYKFTFNLEFADGEVSHIKWYHNDKWISPVNGYIKPIVLHENPKSRRNPIPATLRHEVFLKDGYRCVECGATNRDAKLEVDHVVPVSQGGTDELDNLQTLCEKCNQSKSNRAWRGPLSN